MKAWLKGGLWGLSIGIIYFLLFPLIFLFKMSPLLILFVPFTAFTYFPAGSSVVVLFIKLFFVISITFFILGSILGWITGKLKLKTKK